MGDLNFSLPTLLILTPAAGGLIAMSMLTRRAAGIAALATFFVQALLIALGALRVGDRGPQQLVLSQDTEWFEVWNIGYSVTADAPSLALVALVTLVTACASMFAWYADRERPAPFQGLLWLSAAAMCGMFVARDLVVFYVFFELMLVPLLFLVGVWGGAERVRAALTMFIYTLVGSLLMLVGVISVGIEARTFNLDELAVYAATDGNQLSTWALASFLLAFAIKAPLVPFHAWLPPAYRQAPAEVTAMLSGPVSKAAFWGLLLVVLPLWPRQLAGGWGDALTWLGIAGLLYGSIAAFRQPDARGVVAYSSMAQMGLIVIGLSVYLGNGGDQGLAGAYMQAINHGLLSAVLFLLIGLVEVRAGSDLLGRLGGLAAGRPVLATIMLVVALCALAVPGSNAFAGELLILAGAFRGPWDHAWIWGTLGGAGIVLAAMYVLRLLSAVMHTEHDVEPSLEQAPATIRFGPDLQGRELALVLPLVAAILVLSAWPNVLRRPMNDQPVAMQVGDDPLEQRTQAARGGDSHGAGDGQGGGHGEDDGHDHAH